MAYRGRKKCNTKIDLIFYSNKNRVVCINWSIGKSQKTSYEDGTWKQ